MKHFTLLVLLTAGLLSAHAQTRFGITAGVGTPPMAFGNAGENTKRHINPSYRGGVMADIHLTGRFHVQPQLLVSTIAYSSTTSWSVDDEAIKYKSTTRLVYLQLPVSIVYKQPLGSGKLIVGAGGYIARGIGGNNKSKQKNLATGQVFTHKWDVAYKKHVDLSGTQPGDNSVTYLQPMDAGLNFMAGYELKNGLAFNFQYSPGLSNTKPKTLIFYDGTEAPRYKSTNNYIGISVSYLLPKRQSKA